jgi:hypothetical protein
VNFLQGSKPQHKAGCELDAMAQPVGRISYLQLSITRLIVAFEILNRPLVLFGGGARAKGTQVSPPAGLGIFLS